MNDFAQRKLRAAAAASIAFCATVLDVHAQGPQGGASAGPAPAPTQFDCNRPPEMPPAALRAGATGVAVIGVTFGEDGKIEGMYVAQSSGETREHRLLDRVAMLHASQCAKPKPSERGRHENLVTYKWSLS